MSLTAVIEEVRRQLAREVPFERIEAFIEEQRQLDEEERAVAWLYAWVGADPTQVAQHLGRNGTPLVTV